MTKGVLKLPMYEKVVIYCLGKTTGDEFAEWVNKEVYAYDGKDEPVNFGFDLDSELERRDGICIDLAGMQVVWVRKRRDINGIAHEVGHAVINMGRDIGFNDMSTCSEFYCYAIGWLTEQIYKGKTDDFRQ
tara:strand:- start:1299 stop:1691 length:393 start_codon:yes stop_codon:yes gene_type:complete